MARSSPAISPALHPDKRFLAATGRTALRVNHREAHSSRHLSQRRRTRTSRARLHPHTEQQPKALFLGDESFHHSREGSPRQSSYFRSRTLVLGPQYIIAVITLVQHDFGRTLRIQRRFFTGAS